MNRRGTKTHTTSSASVRSWTVPAGATGTPRTTFAAPRRRATSHATRAVEPVAMPSSTMTAVRPSRLRRTRSLRRRATRASSSPRSRRSAVRSSSSVTAARASTSASSTRTPPSPMAPMASSGWNGTPSLRTTMTSSGAPSACATSNATGTPPRGSPRTTTSWSRTYCSRAASSRPASTRSANTTIAITSVSAPCQASATRAALVLSETPGPLGQAYAGREPASLPAVPARWVPGHVDEADHVRVRHVLDLRTLQFTEHSSIITPGSGLQQSSSGCSALSSWGSTGHIPHVRSPGTYR